MTISFEIFSFMMFCDCVLKVDTSMKAKKGRVRLSPNEEARLIKEETEKRRRLRLQQVKTLLFIIEK